MIFKKNIRNEIAGIGILLAVAIGVIFYRFVDIPHNLHFDEVEFAQLALSLENHGYIPYSPDATGHATLYFYILLASLKTWGINTFALRLPSAVFGVMNVLLFYSILKFIWKKEQIGWYLAFSGALMFLTSRWYFNFARFSFEPTFLLFLEFCSIVAILLYGKKKQPFFLIASGVFAGLAYNSYTPGRFFALIPILFLIKDMGIKPFFQFSKSAKPILLFFIPFILVILPLTLYLNSHPDIRVGQLLFWSNTELSLQEKWQFLYQNIISTLLMFHIKGDMNAVHNYTYKPALNLYIGSMFVLGLILSFKNWKHNYNIVFLAYFFLSLIPTLLTYPWENPHMLRTITAVPTIIYFVTVAMFFLLEKFHNYKKILFTIFVIGILLSSAYEIRTYFVYQKDVLHDAFKNGQSLDYYMNRNVHKL